MIEIRPGRPGEETREKQLWQLAFGDEDSYIDYFYQCRSVEDTLVLLEDGVLQSMLALFPVEVVLPEGERLKSAYIYALATHPDARKKGFGRFLLNYTDFYLKEKGLDCVTIVPAEASLHRFFATAGFAECFATRKGELLAHMVAKPGTGDRISAAEPEEYRTLREGLLSGGLYTAYGADLLAYQEGLSRMGGGGLYRLEVGGAVGVAAAEYVDEETVVAKELILPAPCLEGGAALLAQAMPAMRYHLRTPALWDGLQGSYAQAFAMVKWYRPDLEQAWRDQGRGYMGLAFD